MTPTHRQAARAGNVVHAMLQYRRKLERGEHAPVMPASELDCNLPAAKLVFSSSFSFFSFSTLYLLTSQRINITCYFIIYSLPYLNQSLNLTTRVCAHCDDLISFLHLSWGHWGQFLCVQLRWRGCLTPPASLALKQVSAGLHSKQGKSTLRHTGQTAPVVLGWKFKFSAHLFHQLLKVKYQFWHY